MRGLRGATINYTYLMWNRIFVIYLLLTVACLAGYLITSEPNLLTLTQILFVAVIPLGVLESVEASFTSKWNVFERAFGISSRFLVLSRYIIFICISLMCAILWRISPFYGIYEVEAIQSVGFLVLWSQLTCIAYFPIMYLLNPNKKSVGSIIFLVAMVGAGALNRFIAMQFAGGLWATAGIIAVLHVVSATLSMFFDSIHRGRAT